MPRRTHTKKCRERGRRKEAEKTKEATTPSYSSFLPPKVVVLKETEKFISSCGGLSCVVVFCWEGEKGDFLRGFFFLWRGEGEGWQSHHIGKGEKDVVCAA